MKLREYLNSHHSKKKVDIPYDNGHKVSKCQGEEFKLIVDRQNDRTFIGFPDSMKREEIEL